jgi:CubicO group peptidase (beta-lactamase class C family)
MNATILHGPVPRMSFLALMALGLLACASKAADALEDKIDRLVTQTVKPGGPGCAVLLIEEGRIVFQRGYGLADLDTGRPITPASTFNIASATKQFTAACIALLVEQGRLSLDDDIRKYLPEMPEYEAPIRIRHLMHHTSGLRDFALLSFLRGIPVDAGYREPETLDLLARQKQLNFRPGDGERYSNSGYFLLGVIIKRVTGLSVGAYAEKHIFAPLGMTHTSYHYDPERTAANLAAGHVADGAGNYRRSAMALDTNDFGHGGIYTTVEDLYRWDQNFYRSQIGGEKFNTLMQTCGTLNNGKTISYAFGLRVRDHKGLRTVSHGGGLPAYNAFLLRFPQRKFTVICLANCPLNTTRLSYELADLYLDLPPEKSHPAPATPATPTAANVDPAVYTGYEGKYGIADGTILAVSQKENRLYVRPPGAPDLELHPKSATEYFLKVADIQVSFYPDESGKAAKLVWHQGDSHVPAIRLDDRPLSSEQLAQYEGKYYSEELDATYGVCVSREGLCLQAPPIPEVFQRNFRDPQGENALRHMAGDQFMRSYGTVEFSRDENGRIAGFTVTTGPDLNDLKFRRL